MEKQFILITGLSGSGKTLALHFFEDLNYFCVDNLPAALLPQFAGLCSEKEIKRIAVVIDVRGTEFFQDLLGYLDEVEKQGFHLEILYLVAGTDILVRRFSETRRKHPLSPTGGGILEGISEERKLLYVLEARAQKLIDTSLYTPKDLRNELMSLYASSVDGKPLDVSVVSFGYKYGLPLDADLVFDVRFLPNPYYLEELQELSGNHPSVKDYVLNQPQTKELLNFLYPFFEFALPQYIQEGKHRLTIAVGCTGGKHRSIVVANEIQRFLSEKDFPTRVQHRDLGR